MQTLIAVRLIVQRLIGLRELYVLVVVVRRVLVVNVIVVVCVPVRTAAILIVFVIVQILFERSHRRYIDNAVGHHFQRILGGRTTRLQQLLMLMLLLYSGRSGRIIVFGERYQAGMLEAGRRSLRFTDVALFDPQRIVRVRAFRAGPHAWWFAVGWTDVGQVGRGELMWRGYSRRTRGRAGK